MKPVIYLVRHGQAEDDHPLGDDARALTEEGREAFRAHARQLAPELELLGIATSPLVRAVQTAELLATACNVGQVVVYAELGFARATDVTLEALARELGPGWALVGHNPSLAETLQRLLGLSSEPRFRKGAIAALTPAASLPWSLAWTAAPGRKVQSEL